MNFASRLKGMFNYLMRFRIENKTKQLRSKLEQLDSKLEQLDSKLEQLLFKSHCEQGVFDFLRYEVNQRLLTVEWTTNNLRFETEHLLEISSEAFRKSEVHSQDIVQLLSEIPNYKLECTEDLALNSYDNIEPESTFEGGVSRPLFVLACERIFKKSKLNFLDIGCGNGAVVFDFIKRGHFAVGLEGSDSCKKQNRGYWNYLNTLHTCDVTKSFKFLTKDREKIEFDIITMWEVFEHIPEELCSSVIQNVYSNLSSQGLFVGSISRLEYKNSRTGIPYHVTLKDFDWWASIFKDNGFEITNSEFGHQEYCRGVGNRYQDPHDYSADPQAGFHFTAKKITTCS